MRFSPPNYSSLEAFLDPQFGPWSVALYLHRRPILKAVKEAAPLLGGVLLDVGCGTKPYASLITSRKHIGIDVGSSLHDKAAFDSVYDGFAFPFSDLSFDSVLCTEVLEHSSDPLHLVLEIARVLKPTGYALITAPMVIEHHEAPYDYQRFTKFGLKEIVGRAHLHVEWIKPRGGPYVTALSAIYIAVSQIISLRPFIDIILWFLWPIAAIVYWADSMSTRTPVISLGWQMLVRKPDFERAK
jgi:SAM-dependent methyltransferase